MLNKMIVLIESDLDYAILELNELQNSFQTDVEKNINSMAFERNAMQALLTMSTLKAEIETLERQLQLLKSQRR